MKSVSQIVFLLLVQLIPISTHALVIPIYANWTRPERDSRFSDWLNRAPPAYVWQNDPAILRNFGDEATPAQVGRLCVPSAIGLALLSQKFYARTATDLIVPGHDDETTSIDTEKLVMSFTHRCGSSIKDGTDNDKAYSCLAGIYRESGYARTEIRLIGNQDYRSVAPDIVQDVRVPTVDDIVSALQQGRTVIGISARIQNGIKKGSHWFNIWGYGRDASGVAVLYVTDSNARYNKTVEANTINGRTSLSTEVAVSRVRDETVVPEKFSRIRLTGMKIDQNPGDIVLGQLVVIQTAR